MKTPLINVITVLVSLSFLTACVSSSDYKEQVTLVESSEQLINEYKLEIEELEGSRDAIIEENKKLLHDKEVVEEEVLALEEASETAELSSSTSLISLSQTIVELIRDEDYTTLSTYVHPTNGVRFSPYGYIDLVNDQVFTAVDMTTFASSATMLLWGTYDGSGDPINGIPMTYYDEFIYDEDYATPHLIGVNTVVGTGNMINNITTEYPAADFLEYHFTGFNPSYAGMDWSSLTLVYEQVGSNWYLVGIVHGQWTT